MNYSSAYAIGLFIILILWLFFFIRRKDLRKEMLTMGALTVIWTTFSAIFYFNDFINDYWRPEYLGISGAGEIFKKFGIKAGGIEDVIFWFLLNSIAAVIYEEILGKRHLKKGRKKGLKFLLLFPTVIFISYTLVHFFGFINIIYAEFLAYTVLALIVWIYRKDLIFHSVISGVFFLAYYFIFIQLFPGVIHSWWILNKASGIFLMGIPLEEILWAFFTGLWVGPAYEFLMGLKDK